MLTHRRRESVWCRKERNMKISAVKLFKNGYMLQPFAFGGEEGPEKFDPRVRYRSSLQNYVRWLV
jgi:hypothetical protein